MFNNLDRDQDGEISLIELDFGLKTVNKHLISKQELDYVQVVLDVHQASAINFRMFAVVAALSERVVDLDMLVKGTTHPYMSPECNLHVPHTEFLDLSISFILMYFSSIFVT